MFNITCCVVLLPSLAQKIFLIYLYVSANLGRLTCMLSAIHCGKCQSFQQGGER